MTRLSDRIIGASTETKPRDAKLRDGFLWIESDTNKVAVYVDGRWYYTADQSVADS